MVKFSYKNNAKQFISVHDNKQDKTKNDFNTSTFLEIHITHNNYEVAIIEPNPEICSHWWG